MFNFNIYKILAILSLGIFLLCVVLVIISVKQEWCGQQMLWILWPASLSTAHAQIQNSRKYLFQSSISRSRQGLFQSNILSTFWQLEHAASGRSLEKIFSFCFKLSTFSCIAVSPNLLSVIDVLHTYDDSNCSIWRRHHLVRHSLGNLMKGIFRKTCFDTLQNSKRDLSIWKHPPSTANSLHLRKSLFYIFPGSNLTLNTNIWLSTCLLSVEFKLMICQMFNLLSCNIR